MKHAEVNKLYRDTQILIGYCADNKIANFTLNYALNRNITRLEKAVELINKSINPKLVELENKAFELIKAQNEVINKENEELAAKEKVEKDAKKDTPGPKAEPQKLLTLMEGIEMLTEKEQKDHAKLMIEYNKAMEEENDIELFLIDPEKIEGINIEFGYLTILANFLKD